MSTLAQWIDASRDPERAPAPDAAGVDPLPAHVGLWLDRCLVQQQVRGNAAQGADDHPYRRMLHDVAIKALRAGNSRAVAAYGERYALHRAEADDVPEGTCRRVIEASARSRVLLHPATGSSVTDGSLLLHHTYGVPYLPGSALKGICRHRAERIEDGSSLFGVKEWSKLLFGRTGEGDAGDESGLFDFWDALWIPHSPAGDAAGPLVEDIVNPHHTDYYTKQEKRPPPSDGDAPVPTHILTVAPKTRFLIVVESFTKGDRVEELLDWVVKNLLRIALRDDGIGARTRAGYGRIELDLPESPEEALQRAVEQSPPPTRTSQITGQVTLNKSDGSLHAVLDGGGNAFARAAAARTLFAALPESVRQKLSRGRPARLFVTWEPEGNAKRIVALVVDPAGPQ